MSYSVTPYLIDLGRLREAYGSNNTTLILNIESRFADEIADVNAEIAVDDGLERPTLSAVLRANIAGLFPWPPETASYITVLELICKYLGTSLPNDAFVGLRPQGVRFIEVESEQLAELIFHSGTPIPIPVVENDLYQVGHVGYEEAAKTLSKRNDVLLTGTLEDRAWQQRVYEQFYGWLEAAITSRKSIVTFFW